MRRGVAAVTTLAYAFAIAHAQTPPPAPADQPAPSTLELVVYGEDAAHDNQHALYRPGSCVHVGGIVRAANGQILPTETCHPVLDISDEVAPNQQRRAFPGPGLNEVCFGDEPGPFSIGVHCADLPDIRSHNAPLNFETARPDNPFAHGKRAQPPQQPQPQAQPQPQPLAGAASAPPPSTPHPAPVTPAGSGMSQQQKTLLVVLVIGLLVVGAYGVGVALRNSSTEYCFTATFSPVGACQTGKSCAMTQSQCYSDYMQYMSICTCKIGCTGQTTPQFEPNPCSSSTREVPGPEGQPRTVDEVVARGLERPAVAPAPRRVATLRTSHPWRTALTGLASIAAGAWRILPRTHLRAHAVDVMPWVDANGAGVAVGGNF